MAFLSNEEVSKIGFKYIGDNVKISDKCSIYDADKISIGDNSRIDDFCLLSGNISIGKNVHIAAFCNLAGGELGISMDDYSGLAYGCHIFSQSDDYSGMSMTNPTIPKIYKKEKSEHIKISKHVIIGTKSIVLPGVEIAEGCSVGAMSMVTKTTLPWGIYFGIPAKRIRERKRKLLEFEALLFNDNMK